MRRCDHFCRRRKIPLTKIRALGTRATQQVSSGRSSDGLTGQVWSMPHNGSSLECQSLVWGWGTAMALIRPRPAPSLERPRTQGRHPFSPPEVRAESRIHGNATSANRFEFVSIVMSDSGSTGQGAAGANGADGGADCGAVVPGDARKCGAIALAREGKAACKAKNCRALFGLVEENYEKFN